MVIGDDGNSTLIYAFRTHRQPFAGNLCLIRGGIWNWNVDETAADLIESQMPLLIADNRDVGRVVRHRRPL